MTFAPQRNLLKTHFSARIPVINRRRSVQNVTHHYTRWHEIGRHTMFYLLRPTSNFTYHKV